MVITVNSSGATGSVILVVEVDLDVVEVVPAGGEVPLHGGECVERLAGASR
jgi:hypothetical protein